MPPLPLAEVGTQFSDTGNIHGWVDLYHCRVAGNTVWSHMACESPI